MLQRYESLHRALLTIIGASLLLTLSACGSGDSDDPDQNIDPNPPTGTPAPVTPSETEGNTGFSELLQNTGTVQDIWTIESFSVVDADGSVRDITEDIIEAYRASAGEPVTLSAAATFLEIPELAPSIQTRNGETRQHIDVVAGLLDTNERDAIVVIATPDVSAGGLVAADDNLQFDLARMESQLASQAPISVDYYFAVTTPGDAADAASGGIELLVERLQAGRFTMQTETPEPDSNLRLITGNIGTTLAGSRTARLPAKSESMICGLPSKPGACGILCLADALDDIYEGFEGSWTAIENNFGPGTGSSPPPSSKCPSGYNCSNGGNDPHLRTFDNAHYSPQAVGEFTAIEYAGANSSIDMQWRFSAVPNNRTVSFITAVALGIDGSRITVDPNRDPIVQLDGQALTFNDRGEPQVNGAPYDNSASIAITTPRGAIHVATDNWSWNFTFSSRGTGGARFINFTVGAAQGTEGIRGMLGNSNGNSTDDMQSRDGTFTLSPFQKPTVADFYERFVGTWRISNDISLFDYATGESTESFTDLSFPDFPNLSNGSDTLLEEALINPAVDTTQAETVCRVAGLSADPAFSNCVTDVVNTGDFQIANQSQTLSALDNDFLNNQFGTAIDGTDLRWWHAADGALTPRDGNLIANEFITLVTVTGPDDNPLLTSYSSNSGAKMWELQGVSRGCGPVLVGSNRAVAQLGTSSSPTNDLVLLDTATGTELDRYTSPDGVLRECNNQIRVNSRGQVLHASRNQRRGFDIVDDTLQFRWLHEFDTDPMTSATSPFDYDAIVGEDLYTLGQDANGFYRVYRIDFDTGLAVAETVTNIVGVDDLQTAGSNLVVLTGFRGSPGISTATGILADSNSTNATIAWSRDFAEGSPDSATSGYGRIAYNNVGFAGWAVVDGVRGVAQFDPTTGLAIWVAKTSSFDNNNQIVALDNGGFAVSPFGGNYFEAFDSAGNFAWAIPTVTGTDFPVGLQSTGDNSVVVVSRNDSNADKTAIVNIGTRR